jgi:hypothetical protein
MIRKFSKNDDKYFVPARRNARSDLTTENTGVSDIEINFPVSSGR